MTLSEVLIILKAHLHFSSVSIGLVAHPAFKPFLCISLTVSKTSLQDNRVVVIFIQHGLSLEVSSNQHHNCPLCLFAEAIHLGVLPECEFTNIRCYFLINKFNQ